MRSQLDLMVEKPAQAINDGKSKSQPAPPLMLRFAELMKLSEDVLVLILWNAGSAVPHLDAQLPPRRRQPTTIPPLAV